MTWAVLDANGVTGSSLTIDNTTVSKVYGPYAAQSGVNYSGVFGTLSVGSHSYVITATDKFGHLSQYSGTFSVAALTIAAALPPQGLPVSLLDHDADGFG